MSAGIERSAAYAPRQQPVGGGSHPALLLSAFLTLVYLAFYLAHPALPGNNPAYPLGWWGWWDQGQYVRSARALASGDLSAEAHWYPPAYALLGAPFALVWPAHPFILLNLLCLVATGWLFIAFASQLGVGAVAAAALFLVGFLPVIDSWVVPWTSTPTAPALWALLCLALRHALGRPRPVLLGLVAGIVVALRPADAVAAAAAIGASLLFEGAGLAPAARVARIVRSAAWIAAGALLPAAGMAAMHVAIHGLQPSPYMAASRDLGFSFHAYGWKAYTLLIEPRAWWGEGAGLLRRAPFIGAGLLLLPFALSAGAGVAILALAAVLHLALYLAYIDLLPTGLWQYGNVHYFKWSLPGFALLAWVGARQALRALRAARRDKAWRRLAPALAALPIAAMLAVRYVPERVPDGAGGAARALLLRNARAGHVETYFGSDNAVTDSAGTARNIADLRFYPVGAGTMVLWLRRDAALPVASVTFPAAGGVPPGAVEPYRAALRFGWPCWLPPHVCKRSGF